jgi:hypothetical protein
MRIDRRSCLVLTFLCAVALTALPGHAVTYISVEPIPNQDVVGQEALDHILDLTFDVREQWARLLLDCDLVRGVIDALSSDGTITTINSANTFFTVAAGGFEGQTNPTYVFTLVDNGVNAASAADIETLVNALGYVLSQGGTVHLNPDDAGAYDFPLDYITISFTMGPPDGNLAQNFFEHVGTIDPDLFTGLFAGYTQIGVALLFLQPAVGVQQFIDGMFDASLTFPDVAYSPFDAGGDPTTASAGVAFRGNDWIADPDGSGYLDNVDQDPSADLGDQDNLNDLRDFHLDAFEVLNRLVAHGRFAERGVRALDHIFACNR